MLESVCRNSHQIVPLQLQVGDLCQGAECVPLNVVDAIRLQADHLQDVVWGKGGGAQHLDQVPAEIQVLEPGQSGDSLRGHPLDLIVGQRQLVHIDQTLEDGHVRDAISF